jgi:predicted RNase H-like HicB family nuclease
MQIPIVIEPVPGNGYRARGVDPLGLSAEGATRDEALRRLEEQLQAKLRQGATLAALDVPASNHPLAEFAGMFKDDPDFEEVCEIIKENRRKMDADDTIP